MTPIKVSTILLLVLSATQFFKKNKACLYPELQPQGHQRHLAKEINEWQAGNLFFFPEPNTTLSYEAGWNMWSQYQWKLGCKSLKFPKI